MTWYSKVVWSEGMFLRPHHLQQQNRYTEALIRNSCGTLGAYPWGITELALNEGALHMGKVAIDRCRGLLPDGTPFSMPDQDETPPPLDIDPQQRDTRILLALPLSRAGGIEIDRDPRSDRVTRYYTATYNIKDSVADAPDADAVPIEIGRSRFQLLPANDGHGDYAALGIAKVRERRADGLVILDQEFIPPCLDAQSEPILQGFISEIQGLLQQRAQEIAARIGAADAEYAELPLLQLINGYDPLFIHLAQTSGLHPEEFFRSALQLAGELATFTRGEKRPPDFPPYRHDDLQASFIPLMAELRRALGWMKDPNVIHLALKENWPGIFISLIRDDAKPADGRFILIVKAAMHSEQLRDWFPNVVRVGPVEKIRDLRDGLTRGVPLQALQVAPRQLPFYDGRIYYELDRNSELWEQLHASKAFAFHLGDQVPGLELEFWAIREKSEART